MSSLSSTAIRMGRYRACRHDPLNVRAPCARAPTARKPSSDIAADIAGPLPMDVTASLSENVADFGTTALSADLDAPLSPSSAPVAPAHPKQTSSAHYTNREMLDMSNGPSLQPIESFSNTFFQIPITILQLGSR
ncbi:hypothetical protein DFS34DRAFT_650514 [Phlyctochytrium arcticum]|nr:hypothetical protein DFS34DRAFT_650514 [Phlyctochytrium arcticum]